MPSFRDTSALNLSKEQLEKLRQSRVPIYNQEKAANELERQQVHLFANRFEFLLEICEGDIVKFIYLTHAALNLPGNDDLVKISHMMMKITHIDYKNHCLSAWDLSHDFVKGEPQTQEYKFEDIIDLQLIGRPRPQAASIDRVNLEDARNYIRCALPSCTLDKLGKCFDVLFNTGDETIEYSDSERCIVRFKTNKPKGK
jgi:hypothetical protein